MLWLVVAITMTGSSMYLLQKRKVSSPAAAAAPHPIELLIVEYCTQGEKASEYVRILPAQFPKFCIFMQQRGNKGNDSVFFKLKEHLLIYLTERAVQTGAQDQQMTLAELAVEVTQLQSWIACSLTNGNGTYVTPAMQSSS